MFRTPLLTAILLATLAATPALAAGGGRADTARAAAREGGRTIGAGQVTEILDRTAIREGGRTIGAGQVTEILDRTAIREGGRTIGAGQVTEILDDRTGPARSGDRARGPAASR